MQESDLMEIPSEGEREHRNEPLVEEHSTERTRGATHFPEESQIRFGHPKGPKMMSCLCRRCRSKNLGNPQ
jgi:hypothetical protein